MSKFGLNNKLLVWLSGQVKANAIQMFLLFRCPLFRFLLLLYFRTHKQITQIVRELKKTGYKDTKMTILASREHTCINKTVMQARTLWPQHNGDSNTGRVSSIWVVKMIRGCGMVRNSNEIWIPDKNVQISNGNELLHHLKYGLDHSFPFFLNI